MPQEPIDRSPGAPAPPGEGSRRKTARRESGWTIAFYGSIAALIAVLAFGAGMIAERTVFTGGSLFERMLGGGPATGAPSLGEALPHYEEVKDLLTGEYFYRPTDSAGMATFTADLDRHAQAGIAAAAATPAASMDAYRRDLDYGAARGLTTDLPDPYTVFLEPAEQGTIAEELHGEYEGIGVWVEQPAGKMEIVAPIPGSPAAKAGLRSGDIIVAANGVKLEGLANDDALGLIRGPAGTSVRLTIARPGVARPFDVPVQRAAITIPSVDYTPVADGKIAWIQVTIFGDKTTPQLDAALKQAKADGVKGIVLDLRGNGGGWVTSAREVIGRFVPPDRGPALYEDDNPGDSSQATPVSIVGGGEEAYQLPMAVLVDGGSASASEIVAGALRDYGRAKLIGTHTFGKGLVQRVHDFPDGSSARITFAQWLTPNKNPIPREGLQPDILVNGPPPAGPSPAGPSPAGTPGATPSARATPLGPPGATPLASPAATPAATPLATPLASPVPGTGDPQLQRAIEVVLAEAGS
ncbi:MAG TPA: S41 family peptidase [Thermomicrobiales bacterium]|nr:S41 family peptidase [Thermomicrobiales bacterium]